MRKIKVGFVGLGLMGLPMAKNILKRKYPLIVWNRSTKNFKKIKKLGAKICRNLIDLPDKCQIIIMMLANDVVSIKISKVLNKNLKKGQILIDMSSTKKKTAIKIAKKVKTKKAHFLDAPVSGGTAGAKSSKLAIMVGGEKKYLIKQKIYLGPWEKQLMLEKRDLDKLQN